MSDIRILQAAELALGLSTGSERTEAERLRATDSDFAAEVALWESVTEGWLAELPDHPTSPQLWDRVTALLAPAPSSQSAGASVAAVRPAVTAPGPGAWCPLAIAASVLTCVFAGLWIAQLGRSLKQPAPSADGRFSIAQISGAGDPHLATVLYDRNSGTLTIRIAAITTTPAKSGAAKVPEIWLINGASPPRSLGYGSAGAATRMHTSAPAQRSLVDGATMAITLEPVSPQPHLAPSSAILGTGTISSI